MTNEFLFSAPLVKSWRDASGAMWLEGVASSTALDRQKERLTLAGLQSIAQGEVALLGDHSMGYSSELGVVKRLNVKGDKLHIEALLDADNPMAARLYRRVNDGHPYELSIGGKTISAHTAWDQEAGRQTKYIDEATLTHVAVCLPGSAANPDTWLSALAKSVDAVVADNLQRVAQPSHWDGQVRNPDAGLLAKADRFPPMVKYGAAAALPQGAQTVYLGATEGGPHIVKMADTESSTLRKQSIPPSPDVLTQFQHYPPELQQYYTDLLAWFTSGRRGPRPSAPTGYALSLVQNIEQAVLGYLQTEEAARYTG